MNQETEKSSEDEKKTDKEFLKIDYNEYETNSNYPETEEENTTDNQNYKCSCLILIPIC